MASPQTAACRVFRDHSVSALHLVHQSQPARSHLGGQPEAPPGFAWPMRDRRPLSFLARLDLAQLNRAWDFPWLPPSGDLLFFYDTHAAPDGHDPSHYPGWRVLYLPSDQVNLRSIAPPLIPEPRAKCVLPAGIRVRLPRARQFPRISLRPRVIQTMPNWEHRRFPLDVRDPTTEIISEELRPRPYRDEPRHQVGGFCDPVQSPDMDLLCALVSRGLTVREQDLPQLVSECDEPLRREADEWRLLLQIDTDEQLRLHWPNAGMLYFWIREPDARALQFHRAWAVMQQCD